MSAFKALGLDPKMFKHVSSDNKKTVLQHKQGHQVIIAHNVLSPKMQTQLKALSKVGQEAQTNTQAQEAQDQGKRKAMFNGGGPEEPSRDAELDSMLSEKDKEAAKSVSHIIPHIKAAVQDVVDKGVQGLAESITDPDRGRMGQVVQAQAQPSQVPQSQGLAQPQSSIEQPEQPQAQPQQDIGLAASQGLMDQGFHHQMQGLQQEATAKGELGKEQEQQLKDNVDAQQAAQAAYQASVGLLNQERSGIQQDIQAGHIDPEKYWTGDKNGNGSHSKIAAGLGMILAGFNPTNSPNAAVNFLKFQMEQNLDAQKQNLNSNQNLLRNNLEQFHNVKDAMDMTRLQQADILHNQMLAAASKAATPMAKAEMLQKAGQLEQSYAPLRQQFAMRQAMMNLTSNNDNPSNTGAAEHMIGYMRMLSPEMAKEMETRLVPGVGMAKIPVPADARKQITAHKNLENALTDLDAFTKEHTTLIPNTKEYNIGAQKAMIVQTMLREGLLNTVYREGEQPLLDKLIKSNPGNFLKEYNTIPQIKELKRNNNVQNNALLEQFGLPQHKAPVEQNHPVKGKDGKMYIRQGNYMVPVK